MSSGPSSEPRLLQEGPERLDRCVSGAAGQYHGLHHDRRALQRHAREAPLAAVDDRGRYCRDDDRSHLYAADLTRALHAIEEVAKPRSAVVAAGVPRSRRGLQVVRTPRGHLLFFVRGARAELLGLQVARSRAGGYIDAPALGLGEGLAYLRYEIVSRTPHQH